MSLASAAIRRPVTTIAATLALVLLGAVSLGRLPVALLPDVTLPVLTIRTVWSGAAASEASRFVAEPVEEAIAATPGLIELRSVSRNGEVTTIARFGWGTDMAATVLAVRERLDNARAELPETAERPTLLTSDPGQRPIAVLGVSGSGDLRDLSRVAEQVFAKRLEQLDGVASVAVTGKPEDEIRVEIDPSRLRSQGLTPNDVAVAIRNANVSATGGTIRRGQFRFAVRALTELQNVEEFGDIPIGRGTGPAGLVRLRDVGTVTLAEAEPRTLTRLDGKPGIGLLVYKDAGSNTVAVTQSMADAVAQLRTEFPAIGLSIVAAQARFVTDALGNLGQEILLGGVLSLLVIVLFLGDWRAAMAIGLIVPLSVLVALTALQLLGVSINVLSLGGLALGVGLLVDNAIVVAEASGRHREAGRSRWDAALLATEEVSGPLVAGTLTTLLVFGPIVFVRGLAAALFRDLSLSVVTSLSASLLLALTLMPVMLVGSAARRLGDSAGKQATGAKLQDNGGPPGRLTPGASRLGSIGHHLAELYERGMMWSLDHPRTVFGSAIVSTVLATWLAFQLPREILPQVDEGVAVVALDLAEGTAIEETARQVGRIEAAAEALGSRSTYARIGAATDEELVAGAEPGGSGQAQLIVDIPDSADASRFAAALRARLPDLAGGALAVDLAGQSEFGSLIGREGRLVRVEVSGPDRIAAAGWADSVRSRLKGVPGLVDVRESNAGLQPVVELTLERDRIATRGLSIDAVATTIAGGLGGVEASDLRETDRRTPIRVRYAGALNEDLTAALAATVDGVPVGQLVRVREVQDPVEVVRVNQRPVSLVEAAVASGGTARAVSAIRASLAGLALPAGFSWSLAGADEEQRRTTEELGIAAFLSIALVFLVLAGEFGSFTTPLLVMLTVPLAAVGGIVVLWLTGQSLNAVSLIGMVVMIGLADNDAVVKLDAIRRFHAAGHPIREAVLLGGRQRLRAIAMTSLTTIVGVLPMVFGWGSGGELYQPLAAGVIGGSITATLVTFFVLPTAYAVVEERRARRAAHSAADAAESPSRRAAEPPSRAAESPSRRVAE